MTDPSGMTVPGDIPGEVADATGSVVELVVAAVVAVPQPVSRIAPAATTSVHFGHFIGFS
jgi:hypothetical protein